MTGDHCDRQTRSTYGELGEIGNTRTNGRDCLIREDYEPVVDLSSKMSIIIRITMAITRIYQ